MEYKYYTPYQLLSDFYPSIFAHPCRLHRSNSNMSPISDADNVTAPEAFREQWTEAKEESANLLASTNTGSKVFRKAMDRTADAWVIPVDFYSHSMLILHW